MSDPDWHEADIIINGTTLTFAEAMSVRVAVITMRMTMNDPEHKKAIGKKLAEGYDNNLKRVELLLVLQQHGVRTGRIQCKKPNVSNVPQTGG